MAIYSVLFSLGLEIEIRPVLNVEPEDEYDEYDEYSDTTCQDDRHDMNFIARQLKPIQISEVGGCEESQREIVEEYGGEWLKVNWLNQPQHKGIGYVHLTVGESARYHRMTPANVSCNMVTRLALGTSTPMQLSLFRSPRLSVVTTRKILTEVIYIQFEIKLGRRSQRIVRIALFYAPCCTCQVHLLSGCYPMPI